MPGFETELGRERIWKVLAYVDSVREYGKKAVNGRPAFPRGTLFLMM